MKKKIIIAISVILALAASLAVTNCFLPVYVDSGACSGGYKSVVYSEYRDELTDKYFKNYNESEHISNAKTVTTNGYDFFDVSWQGRTIILEFDVEYDHDEKGHVQERLLFVGKRVWTMKYKWEFGIAREHPDLEGRYNVVRLIK